MFQAIALAIGLAATVIGTIGAAKEQKKATALQQEQQEVSVRRSRRQAIREAQIRRASAVTTAQGAGAAGSSGALGGIGSIGSQLGANLGFSTQMSGLSRDITEHSQKAQDFSTLASIGSNVASFGYNQGGRLADLWKRQPV